MPNAELQALEDHLLEALPMVKRVLKKHPEPQENLEMLIAGVIGWTRLAQDELAVDQVMGVVAAATNADCREKRLRERVKGIIRELDLDKQEGGRA